MLGYLCRKKINKMEFQVH